MRATSDAIRQDLHRTRLSLLQRLKSLDDERSWNDFFNTYWRLIYQVARKSGLSDAEAQDVVQETVLTVAKKIGEFQVDRKRGSFRSWLLNITRWRIADQFRKRLPHGDSPPAAEQTDATPTTERIPDPASVEFETLWKQDWEKNLFETAVDRIRHQVAAATFQMFHLHVIKEMPARDVASKLGAKPAQVYFAKYKVSALIKREVKRLRTKLV